MSAKPCLSPAHQLPISFYFFHPRSSLSFTKFSKWFPSFSFGIPFHTASAAMIPGLLHPSLFVLSLDYDRWVPLSVYFLNLFPAVSFRISQLPPPSFDGLGSSHFLGNVHIPPFSFFSFGIPPPFLPSASPSKGPFILFRINQYSEAPFPPGVATLPSSHRAFPLVHPTSPAFTFHPLSSP